MCFKSSRLAREPSFFYFHSDRSLYAAVPSAQPTSKTYTVRGG
jgi:hypothetical protein